MLSHLLGRDKSVHELQTLEVLAWPHAHSVYVQLCHFRDHIQTWPLAIFLASLHKDQIWRELWSIDTHLCIWKDHLVYKLAYRLLQLFMALEERKLHFAWR